MIPSVFALEEAPPVPLSVKVPVPLVRKTTEFSSQIPNCSVAAEVFALPMPVTARFPEPPAIKLVPSISTPAEPVAPAMLFPVIVISPLLVLMDEEMNCTPVSANILPGFETRPLITIWPLLVAEIVELCALNPKVAEVLLPVPHDVPLNVSDPELLMVEEIRLIPTEAKVPLAAVPVSGRD